MDADRSSLCYTARQVDGTRLPDARARPVPSPNQPSTQPTERVEYLLLLACGAGIADTHRMPPVPPAGAPCTSLVVRPFAHEMRWR